MMKYILKSLAILLLCTNGLLGQEISFSDSLEIRQLNQELFDAIYLLDRKSVMEMSAPKIYCTVCTNTTDFSKKPYMIDKNEFISQHLITIRDSEFFKRAKMSSKLNLVREESGEIVALWRILKPNEIAPGHEGGQLGIYFKKLNGSYSFSGIETIP